MGVSPWTMRGSKGTCCNSLKGFKYQAIPRSCLLFVYRPCVHADLGYSCARTKPLSECFVQPKMCYRLCSWWIYSYIRYYRLQPYYISLIFSEKSPQLTDRKLILGEKMPCGSSTFCFNLLMYFLVMLLFNVSKMCFVKVCVCLVPQLIWSHIPLSRCLMHKQRTMCSCLFG